MRTEDLQKKAAQVRLDALTSTTKAGSGSSGSCMSVVEILVSLYYGELLGEKVFKCDPERPGIEDRDHLVLSKWKSVPTQYAILADLGFFDKSELDYLGQEAAMLKPWPDAKVPGISATMRGYGHGLSVAVGMALSLKMSRNSNKVFAVMGDGELQEGQVWEAAMSAAHYKLNNLIAFVDCNKIQAGGFVNSVMDIGHVQDKFEAFGWSVIQVMDGHNFDKILDAVARAFTANRRPVCIWCHTVAGKGIDFAERKPGYLHVPLSESEMAEVEPKLRQLL
ncbi:MAG: 1-deoxy-D-xylulose-5-phosphate synthase N-terminal domain-containing protein [Nitrospirota bacterium]